MSRNRIEFTGMKENLEGLTTFPAEVTAEATTIVYGEADAAAAEIIATYPKRTGNLARGVTVRRQSAGYTARAQVRNAAPHAFIFENGTQARHTALGANRGSMPPGHVFVPPIVRHRRAMYALLTALLERAGLRVSGDAEATA